MVDDLRPELGCYGRDHVYSPNIDRLAAGSMLFEWAYCNVPVCGASRASILTGLRPSPTRFLRYDTYATNDAPNAITLPHYLRENGYQTTSLGKVFHHQDDKPDSWDQPAWHPLQEADAKTDFTDYQLPENRAFMRDEDPERGPPIEKADIHDTSYFDGKIALRAIKELRDYSEKDDPFFMAVGFMKPHLPFNAPSKYWDRYDRESLVMPDVPAPENAPEQSFHSFGELRHYRGIPDEGPVPDSTAVSLVHGYYAAVSYVDAMIGLVLDELEQLELDDNTIVLLMGDHGWSLGEHGLWCKHSTYNVAMQTPLLIRLPGNEGMKTNVLTEFVDVYPTICEALGLPGPKHLQGRSLLPLWSDPNDFDRTAIYARWQQSDAIRTDRYLYTEWFDQEESSLSRMLYDHKADPNETLNITEEPNMSDLVMQLSDSVKRIRASVSSQ